MDSPSFFGAGEASSDIGSGAMTARDSHLDGLRGVLAMWVYFGHLAILVGCKIPLVTKAAVAVDIFMLLSGYFVCATYESLGQRHGLNKTIFFFYVRRFFRVWPLYVVLLLIFWYAADFYSSWKVSVSTAFPPPWSDHPNYQLHGYSSPTALQTILHFLMLFGVWPTFNAGSALPDWSLSLEFQFYLIFPVIWFFLSKNKLALCAFAFLCAFAAPKLGGLYLEPGLVTRFSQPSNIVYKLNIFLLGCTIYEARKNWGESMDPRSVICLLLCIAAVDPISGLFLALTVYLFLYPRAFVSRVLATGWMVWLGKVSYTIYLAHMLVILPTTYLLLKSGLLHNLAPTLRFGIVSAVTLPLVLLASWLFFNCIERQGIRLAAAITK